MPSDGRIQIVNHQLYISRFFNLFRFIVGVFFFGLQTIGFGTLFSLLVIFSFTKTLNSNYFLIFNSKSYLSNIRVGVRNRFTTLKAYRVYNMPYFRVHVQFNALFFTVILRLLHGSFMNIT